MSDNKNNEPNGEQPTKRKQRTQYRISKTGKKLKRIDGRYIFREITDVFLAKSGLFYTTKKMLISPGKSVRYYLEEDRKPFVRPLMFVIVTSLIYALVDFFFPVFGNIRYSNPDTLLFITPFFMTQTMDVGNVVFRWIAEASAYTTLLIGVCMAFFARLFFRKSGYNFFEIFVLLCYICGIAMLLVSIKWTLTVLTDFRIMGLTPIGIFVHILPLYAMWAIGQFFDNNQHGVVKRAMIYLKAHLSYCLGSVLFVVMVAILFGGGEGSISDLLLRIPFIFIRAFTLNFL